MAQKGAQTLVRALAIASAITLAACGGGGGDTTSSKPLGNGGSSGPNPGSGAAVAPPTPPVPVAGQASLVMTLADVTTGATTTAVPAIARAIVRDGAGLAVPNAVVTFSTSSTLVTLTPPSGTALTDATGTAAVQISAASLASAGAATLNATSQVQTSAVTGQIGFSIGAANVTMTNFAFGINPLSAFGTTSVSVTVNSNGAPVTSPQTVTFSSPCASAGKAILTASVLTGAGGVATASYRDNGCGGNDVVTASVSGLITTSQTLTVVAPTAGSIQFVSATPAHITLKGTGGPGNGEFSQVIFKVVDTGGNPLATSQVVNFTLSTAVGGISFSNGLTTASASSDPATGQAVVTVQSGTISTPVRVLATTAGAAGVTLGTQSDQLTVTTGIPDQASFSVSASTINIEGLQFDGTTTVITARAADHFSNPVPDQTAVNFIAEGGSIVGSCTTVAGGCSATMTSQALRPSNGRVTVLAYAIGEESFTDVDGDGLADKAPAELVDANGASTDMPEAFLDSNENGVRDPTETPIDFNSNGAYDGPDGFYNGVLCNSVTGTSSAGTCSAQKSIHVFRNIPIIFSGSTPVINFYTSLSPLTPAPGGGIVFPTCTSATLFIPSSQQLFVTVTDVNGNAMPAGTAVAFATSNGSIVSTPSSFTVPNTAACLATAAGCPAASAIPIGNPTLTYSVIVKQGTTQSGTAAPFTCTVPTSSPGQLNVTVSTPKAVITSTSIGITN